MVLMGTSLSWKKVEKEAEENRRKRYFYEGTGLHCYNLGVVAELCWVIYPKKNIKEE